MASPSSVLTLGFGSWGSSSLVVTLGFGSSSVVIVPGPFRVVASEAWTPGSVQGQKGSFAGSAASQYHSAGSEKGQSV